MYQSPNLNSVVNSIRGRNIYPGLSGASLGVAGTSPSAWNGTDLGGDGNSADFDEASDMMKDGNNDMMNHPVAQAAMIGASGKPLQWWLVLAVMLGLLMFGARHLGEEKDFSNIKLSVYNILIISFASIIGISFFKFAFTKIPVPGLTAVVLAA